MNLLDPKLKTVLGPRRASPGRLTLADRVRPSVVALSGEVRLVVTAAQAKRMAAHLARLDVRSIGIDAEFRYGPHDPEADLDDETWCDLSQLHVITIGLAAVVPDVLTN